MNIIKSKWGTLFAAILVIWIGFGLLRIEQSRHELTENIDELSSRLDGIEKDNENLEEDMQNLDNPEYLKAQAKIQLNYKSAEEDLVYIYHDEKQSDSFEEKSTISEDIPRYKKWWRWALYVE